MFIVVLPLFIWLFKTHCTISSVLPLLKRLRWLFLSLFILNLWFNSPALTMAGLLLALERVAVLIIIVLAAHLLITTTKTHDIIAALQWWLMPLNKIGISTERLAVRLALVLDTVTAVQNLYTNTLPITTKNPIKIISDRMAGLFTQIFSHAETTPLGTLEIPKLKSPPLWQWGYPLLILVLI
ncbi:MAG: hypothetical protein ABFS56_14430 [Pseudomonadota bacterium]